MPRTLPILPIPHPSIAEDTCIPLELFSNNRPFIVESVDLLASRVPASFTRLRLKAMRWRVSSRYFRSPHDSEWPLSAVSFMHFVEWSRCGNAVAENQISAANAGEPQGRSGTIYPMRDKITYKKNAVFLSAAPAPKYPVLRLFGGTFILLIQISCLTFFF